MQQFKATRLSELKKGDRFHFPQNKKHVYTFIEKDKTGFDWNYHYKSDNGVINKTSINRRCVYLRSVNPNKQKQ